MDVGNEGMPTIGHARVSSHDQKNDLVPEAFWATTGCGMRLLPISVPRPEPLQGKDSITFSN
jgi:hypothetical protein